LIVLSLIVKLAVSFGVPKNHYGHVAWLPSQCLCIHHNLLQLLYLIQYMDDLGDLDPVTDLGLLNKFFLWLKYLLRTLAYFCY